MREAAAIQANIQKLSEQARRFVQGKDATAFMDQRTNELQNEWRRRPDCKTWTVARLNEEARAQAGREWRTQRDEQAATIAATRREIEQDIAAAKARARVIVLPDPAALSEEEQRRLMTGEAIVVADQRRTRAEIQRLRVTLEHQSLTSVDQQLTALQIAQQRGDWLAAEDLDRRLSLALASAPDDPRERVTFTERRQRFDALLDSRVPAEFTATVDSLTTAVKTGTADALAIAVQERIAAGDRSDAAIVEMQRYGIEAREAVSA